MPYRCRTAAGKFARLSLLSPEAQGVAGVSVKLPEGTEEDRARILRCVPLLPRVGCPQGPDGVIVRTTWPRSS